MQKNQENKISIPNDFTAQGKLYKEQTLKAHQNGTIGTLCASSLPKVNMYGMALPELFDSKISANRCHQTAVAMSLAIPNCQIVFANLKKRSAYYYNLAVEQNDIAQIETSLKEARLAGFNEPMFNHSYIIILGSEILQSGIKFETPFGEYKIDKDAEYVIDPQLCEITDALTYGIINHPSVILSFSHFEQSPIWEKLNEQKEKCGKDYKMSDFTSLMNIVYNTGGSEFNNYLSSILCLDTKIFNSRECSQSKLFKEYDAILSLMTM